MVPSSSFVSARASSVASSSSFSSVLLVVVVAACVAVFVSVGALFSCFSRKKRDAKASSGAHNDAQAVALEAQAVLTPTPWSPSSEPLHLRMVSPSAPMFSPLAAAAYAMAPPVAKPVEPPLARPEDTMDADMRLAIMLQQEEVDRANNGSAPAPSSWDHPVAVYNLPPPPPPPPAAQPQAPTQGEPQSQQQMEAWEDPVIVASRIPMDALYTNVLISKGGFGEVYKGSFRGQTVAIKKLLPETRKDLKQITSFFQEIKLTASLDHERILKYIGVAWDALNDASVVTEFMEGGDLRAALNRFRDEDGRPQGLDKQKATIALHVAHALTYMHSLQPVVLHRDLKSKNILLDESQWSAKLTDFGVSRERSNDTMTAAVGTILWMAPEVMAGERYDEKADVFSFGVVLSELDTHAMPYADVKARMASESGRPLPETALLQRIMTGRVSVSFSETLDEEAKTLGRSCVALDPTQRPTAAQVLYALHKIVNSL